MRKANICVVVPAYNEEKVIGTSLSALKRVVRKEHIYVVSDGSSDATSKIARSYNVNVMTLRANVGKARALERLIKSRNLTKRYRYVLFSDADSKLSDHFYDEIKKNMRDDIACLMGTVVSDRKGFISAFRTYEYGLSHRFFKKAQSILGVITIAPGCDSLYRGDILDKLEFSQRTLSEDFDLTIQIYKKKLGKIVYVPGAKVITQDPITLKDFWRQIMRWNTGFWQNVFNHKLYKPKGKLELELYLLVLDSIFWLFSIAMAILHPHIFLYILISMYITLLSLSLFIILLEKHFWALVYIPFFPILYLMNLAAYFGSFFRALFIRKDFSWSKVGRY